MKVDEQKSSQASQKGRAQKRNQVGMKAKLASMYRRVEPRRGAR